jgi:hypothetical protein
VVRSKWPIGSIWKMHQKDAPADWQINLDSGGEAVLVTRPLTDQVTIDILRADTGAWLCALLHCASLETATEKALEMHCTREFDLPGAMQLLLARNALTGFEHQGPPVEKCI